MNKQVISIIVVVVIAFGVWMLVRTINNNSTEQTNANTNQNTNNTSMQTNTPAMEECKRDFNKDTLKNAKVDIKNKVVTLSVKNFGEIKIEFYDQDAPKTVENFLRLVNAGFYDCLTFHRVAKGFVIQGGDPDGNGSGGITATGQVLLDELNPNTPSYQAGYKKGVLAMAKTLSPNSATSQFFIMLGDNEGLPKDYPIFGKVIAGLDVVDKIGGVPIIPQLGPTDGAPKEKIVITKAVISSK